MKKKYWFQGVPEPRQSIGVPRKSLVFPRKSIAFPRSRHGLSRSPWFTDLFFFELALPEIENVPTVSNLIHRTHETYIPTLVIVTLVVFLFKVWLLIMRVISGTQQLKFLFSHLWIFGLQTWLGQRPPWNTGMNRPASRSVFKKLRMGSRLAMLQILSLATALPSGAVAMEGQGVAWTNDDMHCFICIPDEIGKFQTPETI